MEDLRENLKHRCVEDMHDVRYINFALYFLMIVFAIGLFMGGVVKRSGINEPRFYGNSFHHLYIRNEMIFFLLLLLLTFFFHRLAQSNKLSIPSLDIFRRITSLDSRWIWVVAFLVLIVTWLGDILVLHNHALSNDEYLPRFQAQIFVAGKIRVMLQPVWTEFAKALTPIFVMFDPGSDTWVSGYLPVYAGIRAVFLAMGLESLTGPCLAALTIIVLLSLSRRIWPGDGFAPFLAVILLISSTQFLITSMTSYAMPAHLCFNLAWLYCYTRNDRLGDMIAPWIGFFALGLHNPFVHALFVVPFLLTILWQRNWGRVFYYGVIYFGGCILWYLWMRYTRPSMIQGVDLRVFLLPGFYQLLIQPMNLSLLFSWQSLALSILALVAIRRWRTLEPFFRNLFCGCVLTFGFYFFFPLDQVLGWGYRFFYGVLGNLVLLAVVGWNDLKQVWGLRRVWGFLVLCTGFALLVQFPIRCLQVETFVRPFARSTQFIQTIEEPFVLIDPSRVWYAQLLVRNDPFLRNHPKLLFAHYLDHEQKSNLQKLGKVRILKPEELAGCGLYVIPQKLENVP